VKEEAAASQDCGARAPYRHATRTAAGNAGHGTAGQLPLPGCPPRIWAVPCGLQGPRGAFFSVWWVGCQFPWPTRSASFLIGIVYHLPNGCQIGEVWHHVFGLVSRSAECWLAARGVRTRFGWRILQRRAARAICTNNSLTTSSKVNGESPGESSVLSYWQVE